LVDLFLEMEGVTVLEIIELLNTVNTSIEFFGHMVELSEDFKVGIFFFGILNVSPQKQKN
jgi:hypothetical protein